MKKIKKSSAERMSSDRIPSLLLKTALPMMFSMVVSALYNIVDSIFIGMMPAPSNSQAIVALGYAFPLQTLLVAVAIGTGIGVNAVLSKALGQGKNDKAAKSCINGYALMLFFYVAFLAFGLAIFYGKFYFSSVTSDETIIEMGSKYLGLCFIFSFGQLLQLVS
ncbi:MATE family efflux transporter, partial [bacterium]|nr:MATE family efflux transporter [bacterium]